MGLTWNHNSFNSALFFLQMLISNDKEQQAKVAFACLEAATEQLDTLINDSPDDCGMTMTEQNVKLIAIEKLDQWMEEFQGDVIQAINKQKIHFYTKVTNK